MTLHTDRIVHLGARLTRIAIRELADNLAATLMGVLGRVSPEARVAYVLLELFGADLPEVARLMGMSESACLGLAEQVELQLLGRRPGRLPEDFH